MKNPFCIVVFLMVTGLHSCIGPSDRGDSNLENAKSTSDTVNVGSKIITHELAGSSYRKRAILYFIVNGQDTSGFKCYVTESLEGKVGLELRYVRSMSYREQMNELSLLLSAVSMSFNFDSLHTIFLGRLISTGDLTIDISNSYKSPKKNINVSDFLLESRLAEDFNAKLASYSIKIVSVITEKVFFTDTLALYHSSKIETDPAEIPNDIMDALVWLKLKKV